MLCDGQNYLFTQKTREFVTTKQMLVMDIIKICNTFSLIHDDGDDNGVVVGDDDIDHTGIMFYSK